MIRRTLLSVILCVFPAVVLSAATIDSMDTVWTLTKESGVTATLSVDNSANRVDYDMGSGSWFELYKDSFLTFDASVADTIGFYVKSSGARNDLKIQIEDKDGDIFVKEIDKAADGTGTWQTYAVPLYAFSYSHGTGNGMLDRSGISKLGFAVTPDSGGSGAVAFDEISLPDFFIVDDFEDDVSANILGGSEGSFNGGGAPLPITSFTSQSAATGSQSLKIAYDVSVGFSGYYIFISSSDAAGDIDLSEYYALSFYTRSDTAGKKFKIEVKYESSPTPTVQLNSYLPGGTQTEWKKVTIPLADFTPALKSTSTMQVNFTFDQAPNTGTVYIDNIRFERTDIQAEVIDSMDLDYPVSGWANYGRDSDSGITTTSLESVNGVSGKDTDSAIQLNYSFNRNPVASGDWVVMEREWGLNLSGYSALKFDYKGTGSDNNIEVKLTDSSGTRFWRKIFSVSNTGGEYRTLSLKMRDFTLFNASEENTDTIDLKRIKTVGITVSKNGGDQGSFYVRNLAGDESDFEKERHGKLIKALSVINNPFSPDGDGIRDTVKFLFTLSAAADAELTVYNLAGRRIYKAEKTGVTAELETLFEWNGRDDSGDRVKNGLYFYRLSADSGEKEDDIKHIVAVFR